MLQRRSIRVRLTLWYAAVLTAALALAGVLLWLSVRHQLFADVDHELAGRATRLEAYYRAEVSDSEGRITPQHLSIELREFCQALPETSYVHLQGTNGYTFAFPENATAAPTASRMLQQQFTVDSDSFIVELGTPMDDVTYVLRLLRLLLWSLVPVVVAIASLGGYWLSGRALKPVQDVTEAAVMISIENLSGRLPVPATGDEIARLVRVLNSMLGRLEVAVKMLSQFAADASHELRTPLAVIRTTAELALRRGRTPESYRESLQSVVTEAERMTQLVEDLLTLARSDTAASAMPRVPVDLKDIVSAVCAEMTALAAERDIEVRTSFEDRPMILAGNRPALHRLFLVLLDNAVKYSFSGTVVQVSLEQAEGRMIATIRDFGTGIREGDLPHIFERFYRADKARSGGGHGLGLPLAETIARAHGATITVNSAEGKGSTFQVTFNTMEIAEDASDLTSDSSKERPSIAAIGSGRASPSGLQ